MKKEIKKFYDLEAWQMAHQLVLEIYKITENFPKKETYGLISQIRRAVISITANIAEGFLRFYYKDKTRFYYQARASVAEVQNFLILAKDLGYINLDICGRIGEKGNQTIKLINGLIRSIEKQINK